MIFVDAGFVIALVSKNDQWHENALKVAPKIINKDKIISNLVIEEIISLTGSKLGTKATKEIYHNILDNYKIFDETRALYDKAIDTFIKYNAKLSLTDSMSIEIMKEIGIHEIVSFDSDFDNKKGIVRIH
ncbi:MAG: PIN domain-containing protein [Methanobrevibacter sp.]|jgi:predicted nucleic acid-binding protein|nr:PIN domain-containing protein [Candidatus Methanoflexus mossambicus]